MSFKLKFNLLISCYITLINSGRGRAGGRGGRNRTAAQRLSSGQDHGASFEDSNTENESDQSKKKVIYSSYFSYKKITKLIRKRGEHRRVKVFNMRGRLH